MIFSCGIVDSADLLNRASRSHQQLQLLEGLKGDISRLVAAQLQAIAINQSYSFPGQLLQRVERQAAALLVLTENEIRSARDTEEAAAEEAERDRHQLLRRHLHEVVAESRAATELARGGHIGPAIVRVSALLDEVGSGPISILLDQGIGDERDEVVAIDRDMRRQETSVLALAVAGAAVNLLTAALLGVVVSRSLLWPMGQLVKGIRRIGNGYLSHRIPTQRHDEIGLLAAHINLMARRLEAKRRQLLQTNHRLESKVARKTAFLVRRNEELAEIDERRRRFFADVSHELRTPLTTILGEAELALTYGGDGAATHRQGFEAILANGSYLRRRIDDLMALARAGDGRLILQRSPIDLAEVVRHAAESIRGLAAVNDIRIDCAIPDLPVMVTGDMTWLKQCLLTILDNAIKFSAPGQAVDLTLRRCGADATIFVQDMGEGIAAAELPRLFDRFYQTERGQRAGGTGLGLAVARWVVEEHGGRIRAHSVVGEGTTIEMGFPLREECA